MNSFIHNFVFVKSWMLNESPFELSTLNFQQKMQLIK